MRNYLPSLSLDEIEKLDMLSNKNAKYLLCKFNDWIESLGAKKKIDKAHFKGKRYCRSTKDRKKKKISNF